MPFLQLFKRFILRALMREKARSAVATLGITLGVAVMIAIRLANSSVTDTFRAAVDSVGGRTSLRIRGVTGRFDEQRFADLDWLRAHGQLSPVIETYAMVVDRDATPTADRPFPRGELLHVLGVDVLLDFPLRDYEVLQTAGRGGQSAREVLKLLNDPHSVILTEKFLRRHQLRVGDTILLTFDSQPQAFTIRGVLLNKGPARTLNGNFMLMDIAAAQLAADRLGLLDYVDVMLKEGIRPDEMLPRIQARLTTGMVVEFPDAASGRADTMVAAFQFNLTALSAVAMVVGLFLIYNTVAISVAARRDEIGILQAVGAGRRAVLLLFLGEASLLALFGLLCGLPLGRLLATYAVQATAQTVETFYIAGVAEASASALRLSARDILFAAGLSLPLALLAAFLPAWEAASVQPIEAVRGRGSRWTPLRWGRTILGAIVLLAAGWALTRLEPIQGRPVFGFVAELMFMLGGALLTPALLWAACQAAKRIVPRTWVARRVEMRLAAANLLGSLPRVSVAVAALGVSLSMMVAIAVMVGSFRETVVYWLDAALSSDLVVKPVMHTSAVSEARLSPEAIETIRADPDVADTTWFTSRQVPYRDKTIRLAVTELEKTLKFARLLFKASSPELETAKTPPTDAILVSESFSLLFHAQPGNAIDLPTSRGWEKLRVAAVYFDYASNQGTIMMDVATYRRLYGDADPDVTPQNLSIFLKKDAEPETVRERIRRTAGDREQFYCVTNDEVHREALRIFESTFTVTYALQVIAILIAGLGVASTLITLIYQRRRELGLMSLVGASYRQTKRVILWEALILGGVSQLIGIVVGLLLALVLIYVINVQSFGWTIQFHFPARFIAASTACVVIASGLFGLYPAVRAANVNAIETLREE